VHELQEQADAMKIVVKDVGLDTGTLFVSFNRNPAYYERDGAGKGKRDPRLDWFTDPKFLRAMAHSIDKQAIIQNCFFGLGEALTAEISPENKRFHNPNLEPYGYDLAAAKRLLAEGGYTDRNGDGVIEDRNGNIVEFSLTTNSENLVRQKICSVLKEDWTKLGMRVNFRPLEFTTLVEKLDTTFEWDAIVMGFTGGVEPHNGANLLRSNANLHLWHPNQPTPATPWEKEIDDLVEKGAAEMDPAKRPAFYWRIQQILHDELPMIQLVSQRRFVVYRRNLIDFDATVWGIYRPERTRLAPQG
jgi:peptide/nickel transport system substrate-binding protein